ncbi:hypothetical protein BU17DRAFT_79604 [Hysterangium stoloniferum]|nr:hypothetical protein BU17DRAFT_79604 [Hysterangium stoloniferum]
MTWKPKNDIAFVADKQEEEESPALRSNEGDFRSYLEIGTMPLSDFGFDTGTMERLARGYVLGDNDDEDDVNGSESVGKAIPVGDGRERITFEKKRRISSSFMESSLAKSRTSSFTTDARSSTSLTNPHVSSSFSPHLAPPRSPGPSPAHPAGPVRTSAWRCARANQAPVRSRKASCSFAKDHPTAISRATSVAMGDTTTKTKLRVGFWIGFWIRFGVGRAFASRITDTSIPHSLFNQTTCKHKKSQLTARELKGRPIANSRA